MAWCGCYALHSAVEHPTITNQDIWAKVGQFWANSWAIILSELPKKNLQNVTMEADFLSLGNLGKNKVN